MAFVLLATNAAAADPYPQIAVDRPLLYAAGMTAADVGIDAPTYRYGASTLTKLGDYLYPDLLLTHAFEDFELSARFVQVYDAVGVSAGGGGYVGPGVLWLNIGGLLPGNASSLEGELYEHVDYHLKGVVVPHVLSVDGGAAVNLYQVSRKDGLSIDPVNLGVSGGATLQLLPEFSIAPWGAVYVPVADTAYQHTSYSIGATARYVYDRFDVYAWVRGDDVQHAPIPSVGGGVIARFGQ